MSETAVRPGDELAVDGGARLDAPPSREPAPPAERGHLDIRDRVVERVAERAALEVPGVVRHSGTLGRVTGRDLPRVDATVAGGRVRVRLDVAVEWPNPLPDTASAVRSTVAERLAALTGMTVDAVDVTAAHVVVPARRTAFDVTDGAALPAAAPAPRGWSPASRWGLLLALLTIAAGAVLVREALVLADAVGGPQWLTPAVAGLAKAPAQGWATGAAVAAVVVGLLLLRAAFWPRRASHVALGDGGLVWLRRRDLARLAAGRAGDVDGVVAASAAAGRRSVTVHVRTTTAQPDGVRDAVRSDVEEAFAGLSPAPSVTVRARATEGSSS